MKEKPDDILRQRIADAMRRVIEKTLFETNNPLVWMQHFNTKHGYFKANMN